MHQSQRLGVSPLGVWKERRPVYLEARGEGDRWGLLLRIRQGFLHAGFTIGETGKRMVFEQSGQKESRIGFGVGQV